MHTRLLDPGMVSVPSFEILQILMTDAGLMAADFRFAWANSLFSEMLLKHLDIIIPGSAP